MTSIQGTPQAKNFSGIYDIFGQERLPPPKAKNNILGMINNYPDFKIFAYILQKSGFEWRYDQETSNFTVFVPSDSWIRSDPNFKEEDIIAMDKDTAVQIVKNSTVEKLKPLSVLRSDIQLYLDTMRNASRLYLRNSMNDTIINNSVKIVKANIRVNNGIIHIVSGIIHPYIFD